MSRDFGNYMISHGSDPLLWREYAVDMKMVADALLPHYYEAVKEHTAVSGSHQRKYAFFHGYMVLAGLAIENAIKGLEINKNPSIVTKEKMPKILGEGGHGILEGLTRYLTLDAAETDVAARVQECLLWAGKYPVPLSVERLEMAETKLLRSYSSRDPEVVDQIFNKLLSLYPSSRSPYEDP